MLDTTCRSGVLLLWISVGTISPNNRLFWPLRPLVVFTEYGWDLL